MQTQSIGKSNLIGSRLAYGCWRIAGTWNPAEVTPASEAEGRRAVLAAVDAGFTLFDLADIYCHGESERIFGDALKSSSGLRQRLVIATKCGIRPKDSPTPGAPYRYDFSAAYIETSCEQSLKRLGVETIDLYQLHRPDYLMAPDEIAAAFDRLKRAGKAREFGVSNFRPSQLTALQRACSMPLVVNQVEISLFQLSPFEDGTLDQCLAERISPMAWSPLGGGNLGQGATRVLGSQEGYRSESLLAVLDEIARSKNTTRVAIALAWLLKHPSEIIPIVGSIQPDRIRAAAQSLEVELTREEWYRLLTAARPSPLP